MTEGSACEKGKQDQLTPRERIKAAKMVLGKLTDKVKKLSVNGKESNAGSDDEDFKDDLSLGSLGSFEDDKPKDPRDRIVQKPKESLTNYRVLTLKNGMQCLLISDTDEPKEGDREFEVNSSDKAAVCLTVRVGSAQEPRSLPGLAHFLEHMLFMGCKKYPDENEYDQYLDKHGGSSNASTDMERTSFLFDVSAEYLEGAMDRFANQFTAPLLRKSSVKREVKAVDSEYLESLQKDSEKINAISQSMIQPDHPYHGFTCGNRETLMRNPKKENIDILVALRKFYEEFYSANVMCLCVASSHPLNKLEKMIKVFEQVPNRNIPVPTLEKLPIPVTRCNLIKYCSVKDKKKMRMSWFLPPQTKHFKSKPVEFVEFLVGHEGKGSLISALRHKGYATAIQCICALGGFDSNSNFTRFNLAITLSDSGLDNYKEVIKIVFQYIHMLKKQLPCERIYKEIKKMWDIEFDNMDAEEPYARVEDLSENMAIFPPENYLNGAEKVFEYKPDLIMDVVKSLTPERMFVVIQSPTFKDVCKTTEKWYKGLYSAENFDSDFIEMLKAPSPKLMSFFKAEFKLPEPNKYIPEDFEMKEVDVEPSEPAPVIIIDEPSHKVWFLNDMAFENPECSIYLHLFSKKVCQDVRTFVLNCLYVELYANRVAELFYPAMLAGIQSFVEIEIEGFRFNYDGYSDKMFKFFKTSLDEFFNASENVFNFAAVKDSLVKRLRMLKLKPTKHADDMQQKFLRKFHISAEEMADAVELITEDDIKNHDIASMGGFYLEVFCSGNLTTRDVEDYITCFNKKFGLDKEKNILSQDQVRQERVYQLPLSRHQYRTNNSNPDDVNTTVMNYYQHDVVSFRDVVLFDTLEGLMKEPFFNQLRTRLQLGYSVELESNQTFGLTGFSLMVHTQANKFSAKEVNIYIESFLNWFSNYLAVMDDESFSERMSEMIKNRLNPQATEEEMLPMWKEILIQEYIFDRNRRASEMMKTLTKEEIIAFFNLVFFKNVRKLSIQVEGNPKGTTSEEKKPDGEESDDDSSSASEASAPKKDAQLPNMTLLSKSAIAKWGEDIKTVESVAEFHKACKLSPVYRMITKVITVDVTNKD